METTATQPESCDETHFTIHCIENSCLSVTDITDDLDDIMFVFHPESILQQESENFNNIECQEIHVPPTIRIMPIASNLPNEGTSDDNNEDLIKQLEPIVHLRSSSSPRSKKSRRSKKSKRVSSGNKRGKKRDKSESNYHSRKEKRQSSGTRQDRKSEQKRKSSKTHSDKKSKRATELVMVKVAGSGKDPSGNRFVFNKPAAFTTKKQTLQPYHDRMLTNTTILTNSTRQTVSAKAA